MTSNDLTWQFDLKLNVSSDKSGELIMFINHQRNIYVGLFVKQKMNTGQ